MASARPHLDGCHPPDYPHQSRNTSLLPVHGLKARCKKAHCAQPLLMEVLIASGSQTPVSWTNLSA